MLDYLARCGVLVPSLRKSSGRGRQRFYSFGDVVMLRALSALLQRGISVKALREALSTHQKLYERITRASDLHRFMVTDGSRIIFLEDGGRLVELTDSGQLNFGFVVDMVAVRGEVIDLGPRASSQRNKQGIRNSSSKIETTASTRE